MYELIREYDALALNNPARVEILEELSQLSIVRGELGKVESKVKTFAKAGLRCQALSFRRSRLWIDRWTASPETRRDDSRKQELVNELTRLSFLGGTYG
jgi:hypothetical protein